MKLFLLKNLVLTLALVSLLMAAYSQEKKSSKEDSLKTALVGAKSDTAVITGLINIGQYYKELIPQKPAYNTKAQVVAGKALQLSSKIGIPVKIGDSYDLLSRIAQKSGDLPKAKLLEERAISYYLKGNQQDKTGMAYKQLGGYFSVDIESELKLRVKYTNQALQAYEASGNKTKQGECHQELGDLYIGLGEIALSLQTLKQGLAAYNAVHYPKLQGIYYMICDDYGELGDFKQSLYYGLQAVRVAIAVKDTTSQLCTIYNHVARTYFAMKRYDKAYEYFTYSVKYALINHDRASYIIVATNQANSLYMLKRYPEALKILQSLKNVDDPDLKGILYARLLQLAEKTGNKKLTDFYFSESKKVVKNMSEINISKQTVYSILAQHLLKIEKYDEVKMLLPEYLALAKRSKSTSNLANIQFCLFAIDSAKRNYISAIKHYEHSWMLKDTLLTEEKNKNISQLAVEYETEKKEHELNTKEANIKLLRKEGQLQQSSLQKAAILRNVIIFGIMMLALLLLISNSRYRIKKKNNLQLEAQQIIINNKNSALNKLVNDKDSLLKDKECLLTEKEWLLKEIHHRVKNNLQIVISLLNTQSIYLNNGEAIEAIRESQHRMQSISLIHQKLYQSDNLARIEMDDYIGELVEYLIESFDIAKRIEIVMEIEPISLDVVKAVPIGLILNEAITNAIKYAFPAGKTGKILISLDEPVVGTLALTIRDNGKGLPQGFDINGCTSLGMSLMKGLSRQLNGEFKLSGTNGLTIDVIIPQYMVLYEEPGLEKNPDPGLKVNI